MAKETTDETVETHGTPVSKGRQKSRQTRAERQSRAAKSAKTTTQGQRRTKAGSELSSAEKDDGQIVKGQTLPDQDIDPSEEHYIVGVLTRGEAAPSEQDELEPGQTHRVVDDDDGDHKHIERERYSAW